MRIAIASGKGGAGKTSVTASLASIWNRPLVAVDMDVEAPNLHLFLAPVLESARTAWLDVPRLVEERCIACDKCREICSYKAIASFAGQIRIFTDMCHSCGGCFAVCPADALKKDQRELGILERGRIFEGKGRFIMGRSRIGEAMTPPLLRQEQAWLEEMLLETQADALLDAPPGVSCPAVTVVREADMVLLVADPTPFGIHDFQLAHKAFAPLGKPIAVVINRAGADGNEAGDSTVHTYCQAHDLPLLAELPYERAAAEYYARGGILAEMSAVWEARFSALRDAIQRLPLGRTSMGEAVHA